MLMVGLAGFRPPGRVKTESSTLGDFFYRHCDVAVGLAPLRLAGPDFRYTKISARPGSDFIYTNFSGGRGFPLGGDVEEIGHFQKRKLRSHGTIFFTSLLILCGGDLEEMIDFQNGKQRLQGSKRFSKKSRSSLCVIN